jgi:phage tail-like protein
MTLSPPPAPFGGFNFKVEFYAQDADGKPAATTTPICSGRFSETSGIEATMEPRTIREGGRNFGEIQRAGLVKFSTVILKRGVTSAPDLWTWFEIVGRGMSGIRMMAKVAHLKADGETLVMTWVLSNALPVKFKAATFVAAGSEVAVEELHFVHDDLSLEPGGSR